ncbi:MAG: DUF4249 domain-containing protein [Tannerella sp.]|jgi:hypothetical protein|nr:DUF4249 domain-containing protein [Tannerella sp.]
MKAFGYSIALLCLFSSCNNDVDFKGKEPASKMVVNAVINSQSDTSLIKLSESTFIYSDVKPKFIENPNIEVKINDRPVTTSFDHVKRMNSYYNFTASLHPGDKVEVSVHTAEHGTVYGADIVPQAPVIASVDYEWFTGQDNYSRLRTLVTVKDKPNEKNYYRILIKGKSILEYEGAPTFDEVDWQFLDVHVDQEILFNNIDGIAGNDTDTHTYRIFSDDLFQGKEYTLNVYVRQDKPEEDSWGMVIRRLIKVEIHALSESLYLYLRSLEIASNEDIFQEPVKVYTNIEGGYGVLGIYNANEKIIELK